MISGSVYIATVCKRIAKGYFSTMLIFHGSSLEINVTKCEFVKMLGLSLLAVF